jgi:hypothetical protein
MFKKNDVDTTNDVFPLEHITTMKGPSPIPTHVHAIMTLRRFMLTIMKLEYQSFMQRRILLFMHQILYMTYVIMLT